MTNSKDANMESVPTGVATAATATIGVNGPFPAELNTWNWGAFFLNWIWGVGHSVWIALLVFLPIPFLGLGVMIYLGMKGNELAWQHRKFESVTQFKAVQAVWQKWGIVLFVLSIVVGIIGAVASVMFIATHGTATTSTSTFSY